MKKKIAIAIVAFALAVVCAVGGTLAWLSMKTDAIVNTFTYGDINITLTETTGTEYKMIPGNKIAKDPKVTVLAKSEECWLFVKVDKSNNPDSFITFTIADGWTELTPDSGIYYRTVSYSDSDQTFVVLKGEGDGELKNGFVQVDSNITKDQMTAIGTNYPTLTFTAYAVQKANVNTAAEAWTIANSN